MIRTTANPFLVNFGFLENNRDIIPGSSPELYVSIKNRGDRDVVIDVSIEVTDKDSKALIEWINPKRIRLALNPEEDKTVNFQIQIPDNAWAYDYRYDVVLDAPEHYPEYTPLIYPQILKVIPAPVTLKHGGEDPSFFLSPVTTSAEPKKLKAGETFEVEALVENRTNLVDRFHLICSDLKPEYFSVHYPEIKNQYGLIIESDGLELNPGKQAIVKIKFHPPYTATAGNHYPTIRLSSVNNPRFNALDIVYLHIPPSYELELELETTKDRLKDIKTESGEYCLNIVNQGNIERNLVIKGRNRGWGGLVFSIDPDFQTLSPGAKSQVQLLVKPLGRWWNRPFYGIGRDFRFGVDLEDMRSLPLPENLPDAKLTWEPYPKKWFMLAIVLLSLLAAGATVAIAITVWNVFFKQPPAPKITELASAKTIFKEANNEAVKLNWTIENPQSLGKLVLNQQGSGSSETKTFTFAKGRIPADLSLRNPTQKDNYCELKSAKSEATLVCYGIEMPARKPGQYQFELQVFNQKDLLKPVNVLKTDTIKVIPAGLPKISEFSSSRPQYFISGAQTPTSTVLLNWDIANPTQISQLKLVGLAKDGTMATSERQVPFDKGKTPKSLEAFCKFGNSFSCRNVPMQVRQPGLYTFRLSIEAKQGGEEKSFTKSTDLIQVKAIPIAKTPSESKSKLNSLKRPTLDGSRIAKGGSNQLKGSFNEFIEPSLWPSPSSSGSSGWSRSSGSSHRSARPRVDSSTLPEARQASIEQANDISRGLLVANDVGQIRIYSPTWRKVQDSIYALRQGSSLEKASVRSGVAMETLNSLINWGQGKELPQKPAPLPKETVQSLTPQPQKSLDLKDVSKPPEPVWGNSRPSITPGSKETIPSEPLW